MDIRVTAATLLFFRLASLPFLLITLRLQYKLMQERKAKGDEEEVVNWVRRTVFTITVLTLMLNLIPISIDIVTLLMDDVKAARSQPKPLGVAYGYNNAIGNLVFSIGWWLVYTNIAMDNMRLKKLK